MRCDSNCWLSNPYLITIIITIMPVSVLTREGTARSRNSDETSVLPVSTYCLFWLFGLGGALVLRFYVQERSTGKCWYEVGGVGWLLIIHFSSSSCPVNSSSSTGTARHGLDVSIPSLFLLRYILRYKKGTVQSILPYEVDAAVVPRTAPLPVWDERYFLPAWRGCG